MKAKGILDLISHTPLVNLSPLVAGGASVLAKAEYMNPSGSIKDRIALTMITEAERQGLLKPGDTVLESSTGNTGTALAFVGSVKGYRVVIYETTPGKVGEEKRKLMRGYGAEVRSLPPKEQIRGLEKSVAGAEVEYPGRQQCLALEKSQTGYWWARQFSNPANVLAHHDTGREILEQVGTKVDVFVASIGTGGTLKGIAEVLRKENPRVRIVGIQPASSKIRIVPGRPYPRGEVNGGIIADLVETLGLIDEVVTVGDADAVAMTHRLRRKGFFAGVSSGANVLVALQEGKRLKGGTVVTVLPDSGDRYLTEEHYVT